MKHLLIVRICLLLLISLIPSPTGDLGHSLTSELSYDLAPRRYLLSHDPGPLTDAFQSSKGPLVSPAPKKDTALIAALDGTIKLLRTFTGEVVWSFDSGSPIYSSYQAPVNQDNDKENDSGFPGTFFLDYGGDWELYMHYRYSGRKEKVPETIEEIVKMTPLLDDSGWVMLGSKKTTVFSLDLKSGKLINTYKSSDDEKNGLHNKDTEKWMPSDSEPIPLYITRIDYSLDAFARDSKKVLWNLRVSEIGAALLCLDASSSSGGIPLRSGYELGSAIETQVNMPLPCYSKVVIHRCRGNNIASCFPMFDRQIKDSRRDAVLPYLEPNQLGNVQSAGNGLHKNAHLAMVPVGSPQPEHSELKENIPSTSGRKQLSWVALFAVVLLLAMLACIIAWIYVSGSKNCPATTGSKEACSRLQSTSMNGRSTSKKKKTQNLGKNHGSEVLDKNKSVEKEDHLANIKTDNNFLWLNQNKLLDVQNGRRVGKLFISSTEIAKGSNGTVVLEGIYDGRPVAVKRLVQAHHDVAFKEIQNLIASDQHPNIVRWFGVECDQDFVYLSLERCTCSLNDLIQAYADSSQNSVNPECQGMGAMIEYKVQLHSVKNIMQDIRLWKANGYPSPLLLKLMRDVVSGLVHLHELGIVHRDLKPQNVLICKDKLLCAKLSDMGISKRLPKDMSSLSHHATGSGSSGWQAPEQLLHGRQTRGVDMFSLGCVLFFCMTGGRHPFGDHLERDINIVKNQVDLFLVECVPEAVDLFSRLLDPDPELRPKAREILCHPLFWNSEMRLSFLRDTSDRVELEDRETNSDLLKSLESIAPVALGAKWDEKMDVAFINNIGRYRRYKFYSVRDLLRVMRNKLNHYRELPRDIQEILGTVPEGFDGYFGSRFPKLLIEVYKVVYEYCKEEECFRKYFKGSVI